MKLEDVQNQCSGFPKLDLPWVGVEGIQFPVWVYYPGKETFLTVSGTFNVYCSLPATYKGVHMSRFYEVIQGSFDNPAFVTTCIQELLPRIRERLESKDVRVEVKFTYYYHCKSPVSKRDQVLPLEVQVTGIRMEGFSDMILLSIRVPYTSLCPCSKEISEANAHNQRSFAYITVVTNPSEVVYFETLVGLVEEAASAPIRPCLKRPDEKYVTEHAYSHPVFVEDMVRKLGTALNEQHFPYMVKVVHEESIHIHNAVAFVWSPDFNFALFNYLGR